jgi:hypothetical protein
MPTGVDLVRKHILEPLDLQDVLKVREKAHAILRIVEGRIYAELHSIYYRSLRERVPARMRRPTMGEVRQFDREMHQAVFQEVQRTPGATLGEGLQWYLDHQDHKRWTLMAPQIDSHPDQSKENPWDGGGASLKRKSIEVVTMNYAADGDSQPGAPTCYICGETRVEHADRAFCNKCRGKKGGGKAGGKGKRGGGGKGKAGKDQAGGARLAPNWMVGHASRVPPSKGYPNGQAICWNFHTPAGSTCPSADTCGKAHRCAVYTTAGPVCGAAHRLQDHPPE